MTFDSLSAVVTTGHGDVMVLSLENEDENNDPHPYWYARVLVIYHASVRHIGSKSKSYELKQMDFPFVHWFGHDSEPQAGWKSERLISLGFVPGNDGSAFGFVDPSQVICAVHLIPAFHWDCVTSKYLPTVMGRVNPRVWEAVPLPIPLKTLTPGDKGFEESM